MTDALFRSSARLTRREQHSCLLSPIHFTPYYPLLQQHQDMSVAAISSIFERAAAPITPPYMPSLSLLDVAGAFRLCIALRQIKALNAKNRVVKKNANGVVIAEDPEEWAWLKDLWTTMTIVYGGEVISGEHNLTALRRENILILFLVLKRCHVAISSVIFDIPSYPGSFHRRTFRDELVARTTSAQPLPRTPPCYPRRLHPFNATMQPRPSTRSE